MGETNGAQQFFSIEDIINLPATLKMLRHDAEGIDY
jgi:hypothetical protein